MKQVFHAALVIAAIMPIIIGGCADIDQQQLTRPVILDKSLDRPADTAPPQAAPKGIGIGDLSTQQYGKQDAPPVLPETGTLKLSIEQAVLAALADNRALVVEQFGPVIADTFVDTELAVFDPRLFASGGIEYARERNLDSNDGHFSTDVEKTSTLGVGVSQRFSGGTEISVEIDQTEDQSDDPDVPDEARFGMSLTQALLRGAGPAVNLAAVKRARVDSLSSTYNLRGYVENLVATVEDAYWDYSLANRQVEIFEESFSLAERQRDDIHTRIEVGQIAETEEIVADAELALRRQQLIDARNTREQARLNILRLLNQSEAGWDRQIILEDRIAAIPEIPLGSPTDHEILAFRLRPDLNEARLEARSGKLETIQTQNGLLPKLDLFIMLGKTGYARSFSESFKDLDGTSYDASVSLELELPLFNRAAKAADHRATASYHQALNSVANLQQLIALEVRTALLEVQRSRQQIAASAARRVLQEEVLRSETVRFRVGTATALDVARVQRDLLESRINEVEAIINYRKSLTNLSLVDGTLLLRRGIEGPGAEEVLLAAPH